jgi:hypothetical protein
MEKKIILISMILGLNVGFVMAQEADSVYSTTVAEKPIIEEPKPVVPQKQNYVLIIKADSVKNAPTQAAQPASEMTSPRIIYYQDTTPKEIQQYKRYNPRDDIKTISGSMSHSGGFFGVSFRASEFKDQEALVMAGIRTGWIVNRTLGLGIEAHGVIPTTKYTGIDPNGKAVLLGGYGGMYMELIMFSNQVVHITFPISGGAGWLAYYKDWEEDYSNDPFSDSSSLIDNDVFWYVEPGACLEFNISKAFRMSFGVSQRITQDLTLINTSGGDFENMNFFMTMKVGRF